ncbi:Surface antigen [Chitinophaga eiseniae]|uniref:Surface antigen n=1 Tax=Chitinophaga eiseniae TaxID=634771 RepID=A0A1T4NIH5_9BACT|nr:BamA/TamA family outer membrane protein [Chitinophaga eiseniae]SJZ79069.1 Surface antigen [Chitinophaga eiseniae]
MRMPRNLLLPILLCCSVTVNARQAPTSGNSTDTTAPRGLYQRVLHYLQHTNDESKHKKVDLSFIGGPVYTPETSAGIAVMVAAQYRTDRADTLLPLSNVAVYGSVALTGFYGLGLNSTTIFPKDRFRLMLKASFSSRPDKYWGIGYGAGSSKDAYTDYLLLTEKLQADLAINLSNRFYAGISTHVQNAQAKDIDTGAGKPLMEPKRVFGMGAGPFVVYDTRDFIPNPAHGMYARIGYRFYPSFLGNRTVFSKLELQFDWYKRLWKGSILAMDFYAEEHSGDVPWNMLAQAGGSNRLRGYYEGRYRDRNYMAGQVELRQRVYRRSGAVVWIGGGNVFSRFNELSFQQTLVSYGIGYRWEFKNRVNIRLDYGRGQDQSGFYFGVNEVF